MTRHARCLPALLALLAGGAAAQSLSLYPDRFFRGTPQVLTGATPDLRPTVMPESLKASPRWQACTEPRFGGRCVELAGDEPVAAGLGPGFRIASARPLADGGGAGELAPGTIPGGASLQGVRSRYFPAPTYGGERVLACPKKDDGGGMGCARDTAHELCRRAGFRDVGHVALELIGGRHLLADVLCIKTK